VLRGWQPYSIDRRSRVKKFIIEFVNIYRSFMSIREEAAMSQQRFGLQRVCEYLEKSHQELKQAAEKLSLDRGRENPVPPPSEPDRRISRIRLSS
jgi:hypothetical protein